jgi:hypothetical protein
MCPRCRNHAIDSTLISFDEIYKFDYDPRRGVTLEFGRIK